ncbi:unnamed protein product [Polarella glacialis]|uniref:Acyltransferase n=1 Tax=Polarella glacialis TaxID=89957 RepID=A0A813GDP6_POLGL|nr:unnamed protein product [Polarella glacialis]
MAPSISQSSSTILRVHKTIGGSAGPLNFAVAALVQLVVWGGGMVLGPLSLVGMPLAFMLMTPVRAALLAGGILTLALLPPLRESPAFCKIFLRTASLLKGGSTLWVADEVLPHIGDGVMVCYHPHGVIPHGFCLNGAIRAKTRQPEKYLAKETMLSHRVSGVQAPVLFRIPILRQMLQLFGCTVPATKQGMYGLFKKNMSFGIVVGGSEEVALHIRGRERLFLRGRAGFLKYALQFGYKIIVAYNFGESDLYQNVSLFEPLNMWLVKKLGFVLPIFWGRWWCPMLPRGDVELHTVFGEVLQLPRIEEPTAEQVAEWHGKYMAAVDRVFETHKSQFGYGDRKLEIL